MSLSINDINAPCKDCEERHSLCHAHCFEYLEYKRRLADKKGRYAELKRIESAISQLNHHRATTRRREMRS